MLNGRRQTDEGGGGRRDTRKFPFAYTYLLFTYWLQFFYQLTYISKAQEFWSVIINLATFIF